MAESVDAPDLKSVDHYGRGGSSPPTRMAQSSANSDQTTFFDMQIFKVDSTAISQISVDGDQVSVTYTSSEKDYPYQAQDPSTFVADLKTQRDEKQSIGSFVHQCIKQGQLTDVTV